VFDVSGAELLALLVAALFIFGPERLPKVAADAARSLRRLRTMVAGAKEDMRRELGPELEGIDLADLNPRTFLRRNLLDDADLGLGDLEGELDDRPGARPTARRRSAHRPPTTGPDTTANGHGPIEPRSEEPPSYAPPFDADAT
jgi:sec-independent protein translocase protein TatB